MSRPDKALVELKRQVRILLALSGRVLLLREGPWLLQNGAVLDPIALQALLGACTVTRSALRACLTAEARCEPLSRQHLAAATHALALLEAHRELLYGTPARWLGGARRDALWLAAQRERVQRLSHWLREASTLSHSPMVALGAWFDGAALPDLGLREQQLAWLSDVPPRTSATTLGSVDAANWPHLLQRVALAGPRDFDTAVKLIECTRQWSADAADAWWPWLIQGIDADAVEAWPEVRMARMAAAPPADWPLTATRIYVRLASALLRAPGGTRLSLQPPAFARLALARKPTLVALAAVLDQALHGGNRQDVEQTLIWTDTVLRLHDPTLPTAIPVRTGLAIALDPGFAGWLGDAPLLDRYLSLRAALGEGSEVSVRLRQDYAALARVGAQRSFLVALPADDPRRAQLARLSASADPSRTRRRLREECARLERRWRIAQADGELRKMLTRVLGTPTPPWDEAWRDGARLYLAVDHNHAELKLLLRAAAAGRGEALRCELPGNAHWLQRAADHLDVDAWLAPPTHAYAHAGATCTLGAERDPLQALRMGLPFDSCLALDDGCNRHSAIINALDANKWVVYLRDPKQRILARQLLAISSDWRLLGYRVYTSIGMPADLLPAFANYARALADAAGLQLGDHGAPETLNGILWYDDGTHPWPRADPGDRDDSVRAYCEHLGLALPQATDEELLDEAQRWSQALVGKPEALQSWADTRPCGWRNQRMLEQRYGWPTLCRLLGDDPRRDRYRMERIREAPLAQQLRARRDFADPRRFNPGHDLTENAVDWPALKQALNEVLAAPADSAFDDHGLDHALLTLMPRWAESVALPELARALPLLAAAFERLQAGLPTDCADCVQVGEDWLLRTLRRAWRCAPDPTLMLRLLGARHDCIRLPRWLLALGAREHLQQPAALPLFDPPRHCRPVLRALDALTQRFPQLLTDPWLLAAVLRHSNPDQRMVDSLSWPDDPPWAALGDAIVDWPSLWPELRRYARRPGERVSCGVVETFWQRQVASAWRDHLPARVAALDEDSLAAARCVADIGLTALIEQTRAELKRRHYRARREPKRDHAVRELLRDADPAGQLGAIRHAWLGLQAGDCRGAARSRAVTLVTQHPDAQALVDALIDLPAPPDWASELLQQMLGSSRNRARYARLAVHPQFAGLAALDAPQIWSAGSARRLLQQLSPEVGERWLIEQLQAGTTDLVEDGPPEWFQQLATLAARACAPAVWIKLYEALPDALACSIFIHALTAADRSAIGALVPDDATGKLCWLMAS